MKRNISYTDYVHQLKGEYKETFQEIEIYFKSSELDITEKEEGLSDLFDFFMNAQHHERPIAKVVGNNVEQFCRDYIKMKDPYPIRRMIQNLLGRTATVILIYYLLGGIVLYIGGEKDVFERTINLDMVVGFIVAFFVGQIIRFAFRKIMFQIKCFNKKIYNGFYAVILILALFLIYWIAESCVEILISRLLVISIAALCLLIVLFLEAKASAENTQKKENIKKISFSEDVRNGLISNYRKKYQRDNTKREKKGLSPKTQEEYMNYVKKDLKNYSRYNRIMWGIAAIPLTFFLVSVILTSTWYDTLIYILINTALVYPIFFPFHKGEKIRKNLLNELEETNKSIFDEDMIRLPGDETEE